MEDVTFRQGKVTGDMEYVGLKMEDVTFRQGKVTGDMEYVGLKMEDVTFRQGKVTGDMSNSQKVAIFFIPFLIDYLQIYVIDVHS